MAVYTKKSMQELINKTRELVLKKNYVIQEYTPKREYSFEVIVIKADTNFILVCIMVMRLNYRYSAQSNFEDISNFRKDFIKEFDVDPEKVGVIVTYAGNPKEGVPDGVPARKGSIDNMAARYGYGVIPLDVKMELVDFKMELAISRDDEGDLADYLESIGTNWDIQIFIKKLIREHMEEKSQIKDISSKVDKIFQILNGNSSLK